MRKNLVLHSITVLLLISVIIFFGCENKDSTSPGDASDLIGRWTSSTADMALIATTNSDQTAVDIFGKGNGAINVTGAHPSTLEYLMGMGSEAMVTNQSFAEIGEGVTSYPYYSLVVSGFGAMYQAYASAADSAMYFGLGLGLNYNPDTFTLTATNETMLSGDGLSTVVVNGTLSSKTVEVKANTPTTVTTLEDVDEPGTMVLDILEDGTFINYNTFAGITDTTYGEWSASGDNLTIVDYENGVPVDTVHATFRISGNRLTVTFEGDFCEDSEDTTPQECLAEAEQMLGLDDGSLVQLTNRIASEFTKGSTSKAVEGVRMLPFPWGNSDVFAQYFQRIKRIFNR